MHESMNEQTNTPITANQDVMINDTWTVDFVAWRKLHYRSHNGVINTTGSFTLYRELKLYCKYGAEISPGSALNQSNQLYLKALLVGRKKQLWVPQPDVVQLFLPWLAFSSFRTDILSRSAKTHQNEDRPTLNNGGRFLLTLRGGSETHPWWNAEQMTRCSYSEDCCPWDTYNVMKVPWIHESKWLQITVVYI